MSVSMCSHLHVCTLSHIQTHFHHTMYRMIPHPSVSLHPRLYFPCIAHYLPNIPRNQFHSEPVFLSINWELSPPIFTYLLQHHSQGKNVMARRKEWEKEELGIVEQEFKRYLGVTNKQRFWFCCSHNKALYFLWQYFHDTWHGKKSSAYTFPVSSKLSLPGVDQELLT